MGNMLKGLPEFAVGQRVVTTDKFMSSTLCNSGYPEFEGTGYEGVITRVYDHDKYAVRFDHDDTKEERVLLWEIEAAPASEPTASAEEDDDEDDDYGDALSVRNMIPGLWRVWHEDIGGGVITHQELVAEAGVGVPSYAELQAELASANKRAAKAENEREMQSQRADAFRVSMIEIYKLCASGNLKFAGRFAESALDYDSDIHDGFKENQ